MQSNFLISPTKLADTQPIELKREQRRSCFTVSDGRVSHAHTLRAVTCRSLSPLGTFNVLHAVRYFVMLLSLRLKGSTTTTQPQQFI